MRILRPAGDWLDLVRELPWRLRPTPRTRHPLSWPLPPDIRERLTIYWPRVYQWAPMDRIGIYLLPSLRRFATVRVVDLPQPYRGTILTRFEFDGNTSSVPFDVSDYLPLEAPTNDCALYFKFQYASAGYDQDHVLPAGYIPASTLTTKMLPSFRREAARPNRYEIYGRFGKEFEATLRSRAMKTLIDSRRFDVRGGMQKVRYSRSVREAAQAAISIDLPGNGPFCYRLVEYLAVGAFVVAYPHDAVMPVPLRHGHELVYMKPDLSDLLELCEYYLAHNDERDRIAAAARAYYDRYLHPDQLCAYYVSQAVRVLGS